MTIILVSLILWCLLIALVLVPLLTIFRTALDADLRALLPPVASDGKACPPPADGVLHEHAAWGRRSPLASTGGVSPHAYPPRS